ncbi:nucleoside triphosphate pyrophosphohydrolase [Thermomonas aquatica]|uniref:Nucleoside triphosphate pyrophosphohydrolase n=1 Tax=Thermomonas aquatica TaxID=2202149 RepID=A0A5B7ZNG5_9GAMM|nr:nucleoside triphosphate pyrophosphohydrolase [Thermomonas aquatica]QDA56784.1 nucleoside triphosphate pyrophosphohydrolase [Thermomonas aquatica]
MSDAHGIQRLLEIMAALRDPQTGCPWDVEQSFATIAPYTIEEAYEVADAIDRGDMGDLKDELGDLLLQVVFHARMAQEQGAFAFADVVDAICDKMTRRHPHVFAGASVEDAEQQTKAWEEHKRAERAARGESDTSALAGISRGLPEWQRAVKLQHKAAKVGFDWPAPAPVLEKLHEEIEEVRAEFAAVAADPDDAAAHDRLEDEIGDILFVCANLARHAKVDFGAALRRANHKFERRFRAMEALAAADGGLAGQSLEAQDRYWVRAKQAEQGGSQ